MRLSVFGQSADVDGIEVAARLSQNGSGPAIVLTCRPGLADLGPVRDRCDVRGLIPKAERSGAAPEAPLSLLRRVLGENGCKVVAQAGDAGAPIRKVKAHKPDAAVVDLRMPPTNTDDGPRAALEIRAEFPEAGVLGLPPATEDHRRVLAVLALRA